MVAQRFFNSQEPYHKHSELYQLKEERKRKCNQKFQKNRKDANFENTYSINIIGCITHIHEDAPSTFSIWVGWLNLLAINCRRVLQEVVLYLVGDPMFQFLSSLTTKYK